MTEKAEVIVFAKKCPHCKQPMNTVSKTYVSWLECYNTQCNYLTTQALECKNGIQDVPVSFTSNFTRR